MPALPAGTVITTLTDASGAVALRVTVRYNAGNLAMQGVDCVNNTGRGQTVLVGVGATERRVTVPTGTTTITAGQLAAVGINTYTDWGAFTFELA